VYDDTLSRRRLCILAGATIPASLLRRPAAAVNAMRHVVLLGDSVFDNAAYVGSDPDVVHQLREALPADWRASLVARDGAVIADLPAQLEKLPPDATHLVISIGGNDALMRAGVLDEGTASVASAVEKLATVRDGFQQAYAPMLAHALTWQLSTAVCTIYEARFPEPWRRRLAATALTLLNDVIIREAFARRTTLIDLRLICDRDEDFANPIEPSARGGAKIARAIVAFVQREAPSSVVITK
jgi:GDSL-like Lipase/Acylhydrolase family